MEVLKNLTIGVFMGGNSSEREISLLSGRGVIEALRSRGLHVEEVDLLTEDRDEIQQIIEEKNIDVVFIAMHGKFGEDGQLQKILEEIGVPYTGSGPQGSLNAMDKIITRKILQEHKILQPDFVYFNIKDKIFWPFDSCKAVIKPSSSGSSIGVKIVKSPQEFFKVIEEVFKIDENVLVERFIEGKEITVGILDNQVLPPIGISPKNEMFDFSSKYTPGRTTYEIPAKISKYLEDESKKIGLKVHQVLDLRHFSRIDMRISPDNKIYVLEANSIPGLTSTSLLPKAAKLIGLEYVDLCIKMLCLALEEYASKKDS